MTGYGRVLGKCDGLTMVVELRSVNHRFCDLTIKLPKHLLFLEPSLKKALQRRFSRGHIDLVIHFEGADKPIARLGLDRGLAQQYHRVLEQLRKELKLTEEVSLSHFVHYRDLICTVEENGRVEKQKRLAQQLVSRAMDALESSRGVEGSAIHKEFHHRLKEIRRALDRIESRLPQVISAHQRRLSLKVRELTNGLEINPERLAQEVALYAERSDISEELARTESHLERFGKMIQGREAVGRHLDFLLQEMVREVNTMGSKGSDSVISHQVVFIKGELEKLKEQVQNVE
jgi:uncharacterized protein (TIGR00255 family)